MKNIFVTRHPPTPDMKWEGKGILHNKIFEQVFNKLKLTIGFLKSLYRYSFCDPLISQYQIGVGDPSYVHILIKPYTCTLAIYKLPFRIFWRVYCFYTCYS